MKSVYLVSAVTLIAFAAPVSAQSVFDGTWVIDVPSAQLPKKPFTLSLADGTYTCATCTPAFSVKADGAPHAVPGHAYFDAVAVTVVDPQTIKVSYSKDGKVNDVVTETISADGATMRYEETDMTPANGEALHFKGTNKRVAAGAAGAHAISGSWQTDDVGDVPAAARTITMAGDGESMTVTSPTGEHYSARLGGAFVPVEGDVGGTMAAIKKTGPRTMQITNQRDGKVVSVVTVTVADDGKSETIVSNDKVQGTTATFTAIKQ